MEARIKKTGLTVAEMAVLGVSASLEQKYLSRDIFFKDKIAQDASFTSGFVYQHWGAIVAAAAALGSTFIDNPWLKMVFIGAGVAGAIQELRQLTQDPNTHMSNWMPVGNPDIAALDAKLKEIARGQRTGAITDKYNTGVGAITDAYNSGVGYDAPMSMRIPGMAGY